MTLGAIVSHDGGLFVVLAVDHGAMAVAPLVTKRSHMRAGDVVVTLGIFGRMVAVCEDARVERGQWEASGIIADREDLARCQIAAERCKRETQLTRFQPMSAFSQALPMFRSGGRKVGTHRSAS